MVNWSSILRAAILVLTCSSMSRTLHPSLDLGMVDIGPLVTTPFSGYTYISNFNPGSDNAWCVSDICKYLILTP